MSVTNVLTIAWIAVAVVTLPFCLYVAHDAHRDIQARKVAGMNHGRETLARLLRVTSSLTATAFLIWICLGVYSLFIRASVPQPWKTIITPAGLVLSEVVLAVAMIYKQQVRKRVLTEDMESEHIRKRAAEMLASAERQAQTAATVAQTAATEAQTHATEAQTHATEAATAALHNGPMQAQIAQTEATGDLTLATTENTDVIRISTEIELKKLDENNDG